MVRTIALFLLAFGAVQLAPAQMICMKRSELEKHKFAATTTYVQMFGDSAVDNALRAAIAAEWTITQPVFVPAGQPLGNRTDPTRSYLSIYIVENGPSSKGDDVYFFALWQGHKEWDRPSLVMSWGMAPDHEKIIIAAYAMDEVGGETKQPAMWKVPVMVHGVQTAVKGILAGEDIPRTIPIAYADPRMVPVKDVATKTLLVSADRFSTEEQAILKEHFTHPLEFVDAARFEEVVRTRDPKYALLAFAVTMSGFALVFDAATYDCFFAEIDSYLGTSKPALRDGLVKKMSKAFDG